MTKQRIVAQENEYLKFCFPPGAWQPSQDPVNKQDVDRCNNFQFNGDQPLTLTLTYRFYN